ncbi:MAG: glycosyl hydrolase family 28-related protein [Cyclobacteriaceae bacterium]
MKQTILILFNFIVLCSSSFCQSEYISFGGTSSDLKQIINELNDTGTITIKGDFEIESDITIPEGIELRVFRGNQFKIAQNIKLIINGSIDAGLFQIFGGQGAVLGNIRTNYIYPQWFGAKGSDLSDCTYAFQQAVDLVESQNGGVLYIPKGTYSLSSIKISKALTIIGEGNHQISNISPANSYGLVLKDLPSTTILIHNSTKLPLIDIDVSRKTSGIKLSGLLFYQDHGDYSNIVEYPYIIDDGNSSSYLSGVIIENCMFPNTYQGIKLHHTERFHIEKINGDFFQNFLNVKTIKDVSKIEDIHLWNFSKSTAGLNHRRSLESDYALKIDDADEVFMERIFIWDRRYGIHLNECWGKISNYTADAVGKALHIQNPKPFNFVGSNITINSGSAASDVRAAITISGYENGSIVNGKLVKRSDKLIDVTLSNISIWYAKNAGLDFAYQSGILVDDPYLNFRLSNCNIKYAKNEGVLIEKAKYVSLDRLLFTNYFPNQSSLINNMKTVGIRNESNEAYIEISSLFNDALKFVYDGYSEKLTAPTKRNLLNPNLKIQKSQLWANAVEFSDLADDGRSYYKVNSSSQHTSDWQGLKVNYFDDLSTELIAGKYLYGVTYKNITNLTMYDRQDDARIFNLTLSDGESLNNHHLYVNTKSSKAWRTSIVNIDVKNRRLFAPPNYGRNFTGEMWINEIFLIQSNSFHLPD